MDLIQGFSDSDSDRIKIHLKKLLKYFCTDDFICVGGLAIRHHFRKHNINYTPKPFNDLDIIISNIKVVTPALAKDFFIYHYHPTPFFLVLVEPESKTKVDIFYNSNFNEAEKVSFEGQQLQIASVEDQLVKTVLDTTKVLNNLEVDPKQFDDAKLLLKISDLNKANMFWKKNNYLRIAPNVNDAFNSAEEYAKLHPELLKEKPFRRSEPYICSDCRSQDGFTVAPMKEIYRILGYVE